MKASSFHGLNTQRRELVVGFWRWNVSTEKDPVHVYEEGGYFIATLTATDGSGNAVTKEVKLTLDLTPYSLLTGDHTADDYDGKTWKFTADHSTGVIILPMQTPGSLS